MQRVFNRRLRLLKRRRRPTRSRRGGRSVLVVRPAATTTTTSQGATNRRETKERTSMKKAATSGRTAKRPPEPSLGATMRTRSGPSSMPVPMRSCCPGTRRFCEKGSPCSFYCVFGSLRRQIGPPRTLELATLPRPSAASTKVSLLFLPLFSVFLFTRPVALYIEIAGHCRGGAAGL